MPMKNRDLVGLLLACVLAGATIYGVFAQTAIGVKEGDNFTYNFTVNWSSTDANVVVPQMYSNMNQTLSIHFNVTSGAGYMASLNITTTMRDGTVTSDPGYVEVSRGGYVGAALFLIGANITAGEQVYPQSDPAAVKAGHAAAPFTITETVAKTYLGSLKTVNHYTETVTNQTTGDYVRRDAYYEQSTGVLMEMTIEHYWASLGETDSEHWKITQFNSAVAPTTGDGNEGGSNTSGGLPSWLVLSVVVVVVIVVALLITALMLSRRKKPQVQAEMAPPAQPQAPV